MTINNLRLSKKSAELELDKRLGEGYKLLKKIRVDFKSREPGKGVDVLGKIDASIKAWEKKVTKTLQRVYLDSESRVERFRNAKAERENFVPSEVDLYFYEAPLEARLKILDSYRKEVSNVVIKEWHETALGKIVIGSILVILGIILKAIWDKF